LNYLKQSLVFSVRMLPYILIQNKMALFNFTLRFVDNQVVLRVWVIQKKQFPHGLHYYC